jgi:hypothetical protein
VDLEGIRPGEYGLPVRLDQPEQVAVDQLEPAMVNIVVQ